MSLSTVEAKASEVPAEDPAVKGIQRRTPLQLVVARFVVAANIVVDALYAVLDPRVRVS
jgi:hypothetical protein